MGSSNSGPKRTGAGPHILPEQRSAVTSLLLHEPVVFLCADAVLGEGTPFDAGRAHGPGIDMGLHFLHIESGSSVQISIFRRTSGNGYPRASDVRISELPGQPSLNIPMVLLYLSSPEKI